ncbi:hypothetical protein Calab_3096 [Caldithrix abyssi DSM 13497]|uniref:Uncharacterized protein n=1 Tax=Caldithrix abyssi DSM 13497 TaxID=880073 RepID=H1XTT5_CALAY|nr:hypothetical protein Calab_3096 [Caldithrix abyssi DSM 13497]
MSSFQKKIGCFFAANKIHFLKQAHLKLKKETYEKN